MATSKRVPSEESIQQLSTKPLRFAALVRVSTERQEQRGESLRTQRKANERDAERLGGRVIAWYGGQEHATPGWERAELDRLLADAARGKFDAVIVAYADRWSRDNAKSKEGLAALRRAGVQFYIGTTRMDLDDPQARFVLGMNAEVGEFIASQQAKKSLEARIERARRGVPSSGSLPFGRTYNKRTGQWGVDEDKRDALADIAERYLAGGNLKALAREHGLKYVLVYRVLRECAGDTWRIDFGTEVVTLTVPRLLPEETIRAVRALLRANNDRPPGRTKYQYLLNGRIYCGGCGYALTPQPKYKGGRLCYRHQHQGRERRCPYGGPRPYVRADQADDEVALRLFHMFGDPARLRAAIDAAMPDTSKEQKSKARLEAQLAGVAKQRGRVMDAIADGTATRRDAKAKLDDLAEREAGLAAQLADLEARLAETPNEQDIAEYVGRVGGSIIMVSSETGTDKHADGSKVLGGNDLATWLTMSWADKRRLVEAAFPRGATVAGRQAGVHVVPADAADAAGHGCVGHNGKWALVLRGLLPFEAVVGVGHFGRY
jgi:DNA invertase Pin-like site-specific DNA recombinase